MHCKQFLSLSVASLLLAAALTGRTTPDAET